MKQKQVVCFEPAELVRPCVARTIEKSYRASWSVSGLHCPCRNVVRSVVSGYLFSEAGIRAYSHLWGPDYVNVFIYDLYLLVALLLFAVLGRRGILIG
jgi:hypothetical protein